MYKQIYYIKDNFECVLSVAAASLDRPNKHAHSHVFVLYLQPLKCAYKCFPLHIYSKINGNCGEDVIDLIGKATVHLEKSSIIIKAVASDRDPCYNGKAQETFEKYIHIFEKSGFYATVEYLIKSKEIFYISDLLHIVKLARKRIIKSPITISTSLNSIFSKESLETILQLGTVLNDSSSLSFMKDYYPIKLFSIENTLKLYQEQKYNEFIYFCLFHFRSKQLCLQL